MLQRLFGGFLLGAAFGLLPIVLGAVLGEGVLASRALAGSALATGAVGAVVALVSGSRRWLTASACGFVTFAELFVLVHVAVLPDVGILHPRGLAWTLAIAVVMAGVAFAGWRLFEALGRGRWFWLTGLGASVVCLALVAGAWPRRPALPDATGEGPNIVVVAMDAVRRDHVDAYGEVEGHTPEIQRLVPEARIFESAYAGSCWTRVSVPILLGNRRGGRPAEGLPARLNDVGYVSASFSDNPILEQGSDVPAGFHQIEGSLWDGFRFLQRVFDGTFIGQFVLRWPVLAHLWSDARLADAAIAWMQAAPRPFFLYVHFMDAHQPYDHAAIDGRSWRGRRVEDPKSGMGLSAEEIEDVKAFYAGGVRSTDRQVGRLVEALRALGEPYLVVITADHGESLGEGDRWGHVSLDQELIRVPLLLHGEGVSPGRVEGVVGHASVLPTVLAAAGLACPDCEGHDLRTSSGGGVVEGEYPPRFAYRIAEGFKVIVDVETGERRLFDLARDPAGERDIADAEPAVAVRLSQGLVGAQLAPHLSEDDEQRLRALGYLGN